MIYQFKFKDGTVCDYGANVIDSNLYDQVNKEGYREHSVYEIIDHRRTDDVVDKDDQCMP